MEISSQRKWGKRGRLLTLICWQIDSKLFVDRLSMASFYQEAMNTDRHEGMVIDIKELRNKYVTDYTGGNLNMATHPLMRR